MAQGEGVTEHQGKQRLLVLGLLVLGIDTCGPAGSVALARIKEEGAEILAQKELAGRTYSATLVAAAAEILQQFGLKLRDLGAIVVVNGPGSFTGVRVGLSAVKGLGEPARIPVVAVSRLEVLAVKAGIGSAALDAHRREVFLRLGERELLAGAEELAGLQHRVGKVAMCEDAAADLLERVWPGVDLVRVSAPTAGDAIDLCLPRILAGDFADLASLDGHYLRLSDAEIFGDVQKGAPEGGREFTLRRMTLEDVDRVAELAAATHSAPIWPRQAYETALDPNAQPRRVALVAEDGSSGALAGFAVAAVLAPEAELETIVTALAHQRRGVARELFSALKHEFRRQGVREVMLEVRAGNRAAQAFYRFLGFTEEGGRSGYYAEPVENSILMRLRLR